jgi:hypothetical protein
MLVGIVEGLLVGIWDGTFVGVPVGGSCGCQRRSRLEDLLIEVTETGSQCEHVGGRGNWRWRQGRGSISVVLNQCRQGSSRG